MDKKNDVGLLMIRIIIAFSMLIYGINKLVYGIDFIKEMLHQKGIPVFIGNGVLIGELLAPILIIIGFRTRIAAVIFSFNCLTAILLAQTSAIFALNEYGGWKLELLAIYLIVSLGLFFTGAGKYAISIHSKWD